MTFRAPFWRHLHAAPLSPGLGDVSAEEELKARAEQLRIVIASTPRNLSSGILAALIMMVAALATVPGSRAAQPALGWCAALSVFLLRGILISAKFVPAAHDDQQTIAFGWKLVGNGAICAVIWGSTSWVIMPSGDHRLDTFYVTVTAMVLFGGAAAQAVYRPLIKIFIVLTATVFAAGLLRTGEGIDIFLAVAYPLLGFVILSATRTQAEAVQAAIVLRIRQQRLLEQIESARAAADTQREVAERAREDAERADKGKTAFLAAAGHDLRQPMHAIVQYYGYLQRKNADAALDETIVRIGKSLDAMQDLLNSILEVSKVMMGAVKPSIKPFPVSVVLDRLDALLRPLAEDKGLQFTILDSDAVLASDEILLERILRNLALNAIRYTNEGRVLVRCKDVGSHLQIQVWDSGIGIRSEELGRIFEEFYQIENDARDRRKGLGLGLALVRQLCGLLQHPIRVRSVFGKGSVFQVTVPEASVQGRTGATAILPIGRPDYVSGAFIVLIDNDAASLDATALSLRDFGCRVVAASSGLEAMERLQGQEFMPHLIVSDYRIGDGETGIDAIRMVADNQRALYGDEFRIAALLISGDTAPSELLKVQQAGHVMLHKPVTVAVLHDAINVELQKLATTNPA